MLKNLTNGQPDSVGELTLPYYVYILLCSDGTFYTGYTKNLSQRAAQHANGSGARYTKSHGAERIVYSETYGNRSEAMRRERVIKKLSHQQKQHLANSKSV